MRSYARFLGLCCLILACDTKSDGNKDAGNDGGQHDAGGTGGDGDNTTADAGTNMDSGTPGMDAGMDASSGDGDMTVDDAGTDSGGGDGDGDAFPDAGGDGDVAPDAGHDAGTVWPTNGLRADYYDGKTFINRVATRVDTNINTDWASSGGAPFPVCTNDLTTNCFSRTDRWSVRWMGEIEPLYTQDYTFYATMDDGMRVWLDDKMIIDHWNEHPEGTIASEKIPLEANKHYSLRVEYFNGAGGANAKLEWESTGLTDAGITSDQTREVIPSSQLFPADMTKHFDIGVCTGANPRTDYPNPRKPGCNSFEAEVHSGSSYTDISAAHQNVDCKPCSPTEFIGPEDGVSVRFEVPVTAGDPRSTETMTIPRATAGQYLMRFWFALERAALTDPPVTMKAKVNSGPEFDIIIYPGLIRDDGTIMLSHDFIVDLNAGDNTVVITGPDVGASAAEQDLVRFDRVTVENLDHTTSP